MKPFLTLYLLLFSAVCFAQQTQYKVAVISFYNLENFYDTINNLKVNDEEFLPNGDRNYNSKVYWNKVEHLATVLSQIGTDINPDGPALIGVAEIENDTVLNDLIRHPLLKERNYQIVHYDSWDSRGVDVALLYNPKYFNVDSSAKLFVKIPYGSKDSYYTRDILWVKGKLDGETIHILINHWPSRFGGEERSRPGRDAAAKINRYQIEKIQQADSSAKIIVMGDLNDDPVSPSVTKVLQAKGRLKDVKAGDLYNPWFNLYKKGIGTLAYQDAWSLFDQIIISHSFLNKEQKDFFFYQAHIFKRSFMVENIGRYKGYPMRTYDGINYRGGYSDHFPTYIILLKKVK